MALRVALPKPTPAPLFLVCLLFCISSRTAVEKRIVVTQNIILDSICIYCVASMKRVPSKNRFIVASAKLVVKAAR